MITRTTNDMRINFYWFFRVKGMEIFSKNETNISRHAKIHTHWKIHSCRMVHNRNLSKQCKSTCPTVLETGGLVEESRSPDLNPLDFYVCDFTVDTRGVSKNEALEETLILSTRKFHTVVFDILLWISTDKQV